MVRSRSCVLGLGLVLLLATVAVGADDKAKPKAKGQGGLGAVIDRLTNLLPPDSADKLKLSDDQKKKVDDIQAEFTDKSKDGLQAAKEAFASNREAIQKARKDKDKAALKQAMTPVREKVQDFVKARADYESKVRDVLNDDQKKTFDELKAEQFGSGPLANLLGKAKANKKKLEIIDPKKDEPKKDEPKKDDVKKDEPKKDPPKTDKDK
jgi:Spy/CpxP family protein refolding chaperone